MGGYFYKELLIRSCLYSFWSRARDSINHCVGWSVRRSVCHALPFFRKVAYSVACARLVAIGLVDSSITLTLIHHHSLPTSTSSPSSPLAPSPSLTQHKTLYSSLVDRLEYGFDFFGDVCWKSTAGSSDDHLGGPFAEFHAVFNGFSFDELRQKSSDEGVSGTVRVHHL